MKRKIILGTIFPLILGAFIYFIFRPTSIKFIKWTETDINNNLILSMKKYFSGINAPNWFIYNLPDALWIFGLTYFLAVIWGNNTDFHATFWKISPIIIAILHEFAQLNPNITGTFDILDIIFYLIGFLLSIIINSNFLTIKIFNHEQNF